MIFQAGDCRFFKLLIKIKTIINKKKLTNKEDLRLFSRISCSLQQLFSDWIEMEIERQVQ